MAKCGELQHTGISFKSAPKCHRVPEPSLRGVSQFEQTVSGLWDFQTTYSMSKTPDGNGIGGADRRSSAGATLLFRRGATSCTWVHPRSSSPVSSSSFQLQFWRLLTLSAPTAATCSASGVSRTSPGSSQHSSRVVSAKTSPHCLFSLFVEENGKLLNFFWASLSRGRTSSQSSWGDRLTDSRAGRNCVFWPRRAARAKLGGAWWRIQTHGVGWRWLACPSG